MGKRVTYTSTRADSNTQWYFETSAAANNQAWNDRLQFIISNPGVTSSVSKTDTTLTSIVTFPDETTYTEFANLTQSVMSDVIAYCNQHNITYNVVTEDV